MSDNKVRLSNLDRGINVITAINSYRTRKTSEQILDQQIRNNKHLTDMKRQMIEANETNKRILENQIREIYDKERQRYYKAFSFNNHEMVNRLAQVNDKMIFNYLINSFYEKLKENLMVCNNELSEITDKVFNEQINDKLKKLKNKAEANSKAYENCILSKIDELADDLKKKREIAENMKMPSEVDENYNLEANYPRMIGIVIVTIIFIILLKNALSEGFESDISILFLFSTGVLSSLLFYNEIKWRMSLSTLKAEASIKKAEFEKNKSSIEQQYKKDLLAIQEQILNHPLNNAMEEIDLNHPNFESVINEMRELEVTFMKKWDIDAIA